jgi:hypothetical protein
MAQLYDLTVCVMVGFFSTSTILVYLLKELESGTDDISLVVAQNISNTWKYVYAGCN